VDEETREADPTPEPDADAHVEDPEGGEFRVQVGWGSDFGSPATQEPEVPQEPEVRQEPEATDEPAATEDPFAPAEAEDPFAPTADAPMGAPPVESTPTEESDSRTESVSAPEPVPAEPPAAPPPGFQFGRRDPRDKAKRLARVLVSDIITYNPERHARALENGTLEEDFADEIRKSWAEYVEQVGAEIAEGTPYFTDALNDILARGRRVF
jgi:hypothetical protein